MANLNHQQNLTKRDETSQQSTSTITTPTDDSDAHNAHLAKQNLIKEAWSKRNNVIYGGLGKMMAQAYEAALKNIKWEDKFKKCGKKTEVRENKYLLTDVFTLSYV